jgi:Rrf2 family protein
MFIKQKTQYALRALFELAKRKGQGPTKIFDIAKAQAIPTRFLEVIMNQLKHNGLVVSKRGYYGGYTLVASPEQVTVGQVFRSMENPTDLVQCKACETKKNCPFSGKCAFRPMWEKAQDAVLSIYDQTTLQDLLNQDKQLN